MKKSFVLALVSSFLLGSVIAEAQTRARPSSQGGTTVSRSAARPSASVYGRPATSSSTVRSQQVYRSSGYAVARPYYRPIPYSYARSYGVYQPRYFPVYGYLNFHPRLHCWGRYYWNGLQWSFYRILDSVLRRVEGPQVVVVDRSELPPQYGQSGGRYEQPAPEEPDTAATEPAPMEFQLANKTRVYVEAYDGETYIGRMAPGATLKVGQPKTAYRGEAFLPQSNGTLLKSEPDLTATPNGWAFVAPQPGGER